jgi:hypothetical protein
MFEAMKEESPESLFWGEIDAEVGQDDILVDGHFRFRAIAAIVRRKLGKHRSPSE